MLPFVRDSLAVTASQRASTFVALLIGIEMDRVTKGFQIARVFVFRTKYTTREAQSCREICAHVLRLAALKEGALMVKGDL